MGWRPTDKSGKQLFNDVFKANLALRHPADFQRALRVAVDATDATTCSTRARHATLEPPKLVELRQALRSTAEGAERCLIQKQFSSEKRRWLAHIRALRLDRLAERPCRHTGKNRRVPDKLGSEIVRAKWPAMMATLYEQKCRRNLETAESLMIRLKVLECRGRCGMRGSEEVRLKIGMTVLLQSVAKLPKSKGVGRDCIPAEALKALD